MQYLSSLDILYITLSVFTAILGTLISILIFKLIKILGPVLEILNYYKKIKSYLEAYAGIPDMVKDKVFEIFGSIGKDKK